MAYETLEKAFHKDASSERFANADRLWQERLCAESTFRTGIMTETGELFCAMPRELTLLSDAVLSHEVRIAAALSSLPRVAHDALVRGLVVDEVVCSNDLEGVYSTRRQVSDLLDQGPSPSGPLADRRFRELAHLYLELDASAAVIDPQTPADVRAIYDRVMSGEPLDEGAPDGELFRKGAVEVIGRGGKVLHQGVYPEAKIVEAVGRMLELGRSAELPPTLAAIIGHYLFEYIHPFYDGNGRTGRYLLALGLSRPLSILTALSLSRVIAEDRAPYYRAFRVVQDPLNHAELTPFVIEMLAYTIAAQERILEDLAQKTARLAHVEKSLEVLARTHGLSAKERDVLLMLAQRDLFAAFPDVLLDDVATHLGVGPQMARKHVKALEDRELVERVAVRPTRFALSDGARTALGLG